MLPLDQSFQVERKRETERKKRERERKRERKERERAMKGEFLTKIDKHYKLQD